MAGTLLEDLDVIGNDRLERKHSGELVAVRPLARSVRSVGSQEQHVRVFFDRIAARVTGE